jgi:hypothetical protein
MLSLWRKKSVVENLQKIKDNNLSVGSLVVPGGLELYKSIILKCYTLHDAYVSASDFGLKLTEIMYQAFRLKLIPCNNIVGDTCVKLESSDFAGLFISVDHNDNIYLTFNPDDAENFNVITGLSNPWHISFQHIKSGKYLKHQNGILRIDHCENNKQYSMEATFLPISPFPKTKLNIILRGHIRNAFQNKDLCVLLNDLAFQFDISIYIHSWNIVQSSLSYRSMRDDFSVVDETIIKNYFGEYLSKYIKHIIIDDDNKIELLGSLDGFVGATRCPLKGFKNMLYGQTKITEYVYNNVDQNEKLMQFRFDILSSSNPFTLKINDIIDFLTRNTITDSNVEKIKFINYEPSMGIDNIYMGSVANMHNFMSWFYSHFDEIHEKYRTIGHQEYICFYERNNFINNNY